MQTPIRLGLIGCGGIVQLQHLPTLLDLNEVQIAALADPVTENLAKVASATGVPPDRHYADYRDMLLRLSDPRCRERGFDLRAFRPRPNHRRHPAHKFLRQTFRSLRDAPRRRKPQLAQISSLHLSNVHLPGYLPR